MVPCNVGSSGSVEPVTIVLNCSAELARFGSVGSVEPAVG